MYLYYYHGRIHTNCPALFIKDMIRLDNLPFDAPAPEGLLPDELDKWEAASRERQAREAGPKAQTESAIKAFKPRDKCYIEWDPTAPSLGVRIATTGTKHFVVWADVRGRVRQKVLGAIWDYTVDEARARAQAWLSVEGIRQWTNEILARAVAFRERRAAKFKTPAACSKAPALRALSAASARKSKGVSEAVLQFAQAGSLASPREVIQFHC